METKKTREYCISDIQVIREQLLYLIMMESIKKQSAGYMLVSSELLTEKFRPLFTVSDDIHGIRLQ